MSEVAVKWTPRRLAHTALDAIKRHPETWDQSMWALHKDCGTTLCFAGHVVHVHDPGASPLGDSRVRLSSGRIDFYPDVAERLLDIDEETSADLFASDLSLTELTRNVGRIIGPREESEHATDGA